MMKVKKIMSSSIKKFSSIAGGVDKESVDCVVIGAGVVGIAIARELSLNYGRNVFVIESASTFGTATSSRNSQVIHAGIYYPNHSLKIDGKDFVESLYLEADLDCSTIDNHDGSVNFGNVRERNGRNYGGGNSAYKVFDEMSSIKSIEQDGSVREYCDVFVSFANRVGWDDSCSISMFIWGLQPEEDNEVKQDSNNVSVTANNLDVSIVTNSDLTKPNEDFRKEIKDDVVIASNDENEVIDNTGLMGFAEASNENVNDARLSEIQEEKVYEDEEAAVTREQIDLGRLIHGDDDMKVNTSENVVSEFMVVEIDKFEGCVNGDERDYVPERNKQHERNVCENSVSICSPYTNRKEAGEGRCNSFVENKTEYGVEQDDYIKGLGKQNTRNDISLMEMTTMFEKRKGTEVKKIRKRHGFGAMDYGDSLFPMLGLDGYSGADGTELLTLNQIMQVLIQNFNMMTINFDRTIIGYQNFTCGRESDKKMGDLSESFLIVDLEVAKINEGGMYCLAKNREWKFDIWRWPKWKKRGVKCGRLNKNKEILATYSTTYTSLKRLIQQISWMQWDATNTNTEDLVQWQDWIRRFLHLIWFTGTLMFLVDKKPKGDGMTKVELLDQCTVECLGGMERETCDKMRNSVKKDGSGVHKRKLWGVWERRNWFIIGRLIICIDGKDFVESLYLEADLDCSMIDNHGGSVNFGNVRERNGRNYGGGNSAYGVRRNDDLCSVSMFIWGLQPEIGTQVTLFKPNTLSGAYCLAIMQESTNKLLGQSCSKNVDLNSVGLDVGCLRRDGNRIFINKEDNEVKQDYSVSDVSVTANNLDVSIVTSSDLTKPNEDFRKEIKDDVVIESNDENEVIDYTGLMGFAEASNENVNGKRMELRVCERDNNSYQNFTCGRESDKKMGDLSESSLIVDLEVAKINEGSLGHLKFDMRNSVKKDGSRVHEKEVMGCLGKKELVYYWKSDNRGLLCSKNSDLNGLMRNDHLTSLGIARFCVRGRRLLYEYCKEHGIPHKQIGKLIVASRHEEVPNLHYLLKRGIENGVDGLKMMDGSEAMSLEPELQCVRALWSPTSGIIDSHSLMLSQMGEAESHGTTFCYNNTVIGAHVEDNQIYLHISETESLRNCDHKSQWLPDILLLPKLVVNSAGLSATALARCFSGINYGVIPRSHYARGCYFSLTNTTVPPFTHLIYPIPEDGGLGVHVTLDLDGQVKFGPDVEWLNEIDDISSIQNKFEYTVCAGRAKKFYPEIRKYYPSLKNESLQPAYAGIRPKLSGPGEGFVDFIIQGEESHGIPGLVNLFGIESPGLASSITTQGWPSGKRVCGYHSKMCEVSSSYVQTTLKWPRQPPEKGGLYLIFGHHHQDVHHRPPPFLDPRRRNLGLNIEFWVYLDACSGVVSVVSIEYHKVIESVNSGYTIKVDDYHAALEPNDDYEIGQMSTESMVQMDFGLMKNVRPYDMIFRIDEEA
nr:L-2-hydroxyglutarate dehydrogenase, mitochondrial [Tanacetum cinerariifolium]